MSRYFPQLYRSSKDIKVEFGLTNYAMKFDIKKTRDASSSSSSFVKKIIQLTRTR